MGERENEDKNHSFDILLSYGFDFWISGRFRSELFNLISTCYNFFSKKKKKGEKESQQKV